MPWDFALILLALAIAVPLLGRRRMRRLLETETTTKRERLWLYASTVISQWLATAAVVWRAYAHNISLGQLGWQVPHAALVIVVSGILTTLILVNQLLSLQHISSEASDTDNTMLQLALRIFPQDAWERVAFLGVVLTVAFCEELLYRGFAQAVLQRWTGHAWIAIAVAGALFGFAHLYQGIRGVSSTFVVGLIFSTIRWWTGSLVPVVVTHFVADLTVGLLAPARVRSLSLADPSHQLE